MSNDRLMFPCPITGENVDIDDDCAECSRKLVKVKDTNGNVRRISQCDIYALMLDEIGELTNDE